MGFFALLKSLDALIYEVMSWLVFYPLTMWRAVRYPIRMMDYADSELGDEPAEQYTDTLSPPLFLFLTLLLQHGLELALVGESAVVRSTRHLQALITSDTALITLRVVLFSLFPLVMALRLLRQQGVKVTRDSLRPPFYSQCYAAAPFAVAISLSFTMDSVHRPWAPFAMLALLAATLIWYGTLQIRWFAEHLGGSLRRGIWNASVAMIECLVLESVVLALFTA
ncbi:MAG TPA: hypothetical protein VF404_08640 [Sphingomonas sp.]